MWNLGRGCRTGMSGSIEKRSPNKNQAYIDHGHKELVDEDKHDDGRDDDKAKDNQFLPSESQLLFRQIFWIGRYKNDTTQRKII